MNGFFQGMTALVRGAQACLTYAPARRRAVIPLVIGVTVSFAFAGTLVSFFQSFVQTLGISVKESGYFLGVLYQILLGIGIAVAMPIVLLLFVTLLSAYFQLELAQVVFRRRGIEPQIAEGGMIQEIFRAVLHEFKKLIIFFPFSVFAVIAGFLPLLIPVAFVVGIFLLGAQFVDVALEARGLPSEARLRLLKDRPIPIFVFGAQIALITLIPLAFIILSPIATAGAAELVSDLEQ